MSERIVYTERNPNSWSAHNFTQANNKKNNNKKRLS